MSTDEEHDLVRRIDKIEVAVESIAQSLHEIAREQRDERTRHRFDGGKLMTLTAVVVAVVLSAASMLLSVYVEPIRVQIRAHELATQRQSEWMLDTQFRLGEMSAREAAQSPPAGQVASN